VHAPHTPVANVLLLLLLPVAFLHTYCCSNLEE
jgi:hypothetical protein